MIVVTSGFGWGREWGCSYNDYNTHIWAPLPFQEASLWNPPHLVTAHAMVCGPVFKILTKFRQNFAKFADFGPSEI